MTEDQKYEIAILAEDYQQKRQIFEYHKVLNIMGKTADELLKMSLAYHTAEAEMLEAQGRLDRAKLAAYQRL